MKITATVRISSTRDAIWAAITDIENAASVIAGIQAIEVLEKPSDGLLGFKWSETRKLFGKTASETMWVIEVVEGEFFRAQAESNGCIYITTTSITEDADGLHLTKLHDAQPQGFGAKIMCGVMGVLFKGAMVKLFLNDLNDVKAAVES